MDSVKKILFLTYCYPPMKSPRSVQISHLHNAIKEDYCVKIITSETEVSYDNSLLQFTNLNNVEIAKKSWLTKCVEKSRGEIVKKSLLPDYAYLWHFDLLKKTVKVIGSFKPDIIITFGQPMSTHITGLKLKKKYPYLKWITHFSDPWVENIFNNYNYLVKKLNNYYQHKVLQYCDNAIFTSQEALDLVTKPYAKSIRNKSIVMPHIFDNSLYKIKEKKHNNNFLIRYIGNFYGKRSPENLFKAIKYLQPSVIEDLRIEIVGSATYNITNLIKKYKLTNIVFHKDPVSYLDSLSMMLEADLLLLIDAPTKISPFLPSKLIDYIGANKPIFGITPLGTAKNLIEKIGFLVADPNNPNEIANKFKYMIKKIKSQKINSNPSIIKNIKSSFTMQNVRLVFKELLRLNLGR